jgi:hypothetical protein
MSQGEKVSLASPQSDEASSASVKQAFLNLIDAMKFAQRFGEISSKVVEIEQLSRKRAEALDKLAAQIADLISSTKEVLGDDNTIELSKQIVSFSTLAVEQAKKKVGEQSATEHANLLGSEDAEKTKTFKAIEDLLASTPFQVHDKTISLKLVEGAYDAKCLYVCEEGIQYEFALDCKQSFDFKKEFKLSGFGREVKIPINLGKSWLKKQPVPGYERLDSYILSSVEASDGNVIASFNHPQREASIKLVYSKRDSRSSLAVEFNELNHKVVVTSDASLNKFLETDIVSNQMGQLWLSLQDLENYRSGLIKLTRKDQNVLQSGDYLEFFASAWKVIAPKISTLLKEGDPEFNEKIAREKIASLGDGGQPILSILNLAS